MLLKDVLKGIDYNILKKGNKIYGPASFFSMRALKKVGKFNENLKYWMDYEMYIRVSKIMKLKYINLDIANFRIRLHQRSRDDKNRAEMLAERKKIRKKYDKKLYFEPLIMGIDLLVNKLIKFIKYYLKTI